MISYRRCGGGREYGKELSSTVIGWIIRVMAEWTAHTASSNSSTSSSAKATAAAETTTSAASGHPTSGHPSLSSSVRRLAGRKGGGDW